MNTKEISKSGTKMTERDGEDVVCLIESTVNGSSAAT